MSSPSLDAAYGIDRRAAYALGRLGVIAGNIEATDQGPLRFRFNFSFSCDRELAKYHVATFLNDEYNATHVDFFANRKRPTQCYAYFTWRS